MLKWKRLDYTDMAAEKMTDQIADLVSPMATAKGMDMRFKLAPCPSSST